MKTSTKIFITLIVCMLAIVITWGEVALILLVAKWAGLQFAFFKCSILITVILMLIKGFFKSTSKK